MKNLFPENISIRGYVWFLRQAWGDNSIGVVIVIWGSWDVFNKLDVITEAVKNTLPPSGVLKYFEIDILTVAPQYRKPFIMRYVNDSAKIVDCGFISEDNSEMDEIN